MAGTTFKSIADLWADVLDFIYPQRCPVCGSSLDSRRESLCRSCLSELREKRKLLGPFCPCCKREVGSLAEGCLCENGDGALTAVFSLGVYDEEMEALVHDFKYKRKKRLGLLLSELLSERLLQVKKLPPADYVVPVPLHKSKTRERGFNQSALIAEELSGKLGIPARPNLLRRKRKTRTQTGLSREQRRENVRDAFRLSPSINLEGTNLLLVDDVLTTGATMSECARSLRDAGAEKIWGVTLAVATGTEPFRP